MPNYNEWVDELSKRTGAPVEQSDIDRLNATNPDDPNNPENNDTTRLMQALEAQYERRGKSGGTDSAELTRQGYGSGRDETADDRPSNQAAPSSVANAWNGGGNGSGGSNADSLFPDWYRELLTRQQQQAEEERTANKARSDALYGQLNERATQSLQIDRNDPIIRTQADAFSANQDRARRNYISDVAEREGPLGNIRGEQRMANERYGQATGDFEAQLLGRELSARRDEIAEALRMSAGMLSGDQQRTLQSQLSMLDAAISEAGIGLGARGQDLNYSLGARGQDFGMDQFLRELALREYDTVNRWDYNWQTL